MAETATYLGDTLRTLTVTTALGLLLLVGACSPSYDDDCADDVTADCDDGYDGGSNGYKPGNKGGGNKGGGGYKGGGGGRR